MITKIQNVFKEAFHFLVIICNLKKIKSKRYWFVYTYIIK